MSTTPLPALNPHLEFSEPSDDGRVTVIDSVRGGHYSLAAESVSALLLMDGTATSEDVVQRLSERGISVSVDDVTALAGQAKSLGLVGTSKTTPAPAYAAGPTGNNPFFWRIASINPERFFSCMAPAFRWLFSWTGLVLQVLAVVTIGWGVVTHWSDIGESMRRFAHPLFLPALWLTIAAMTVLHECGHGVATSILGGKPNRAGVALYLFLPAGFVDTSSSWRLSRRDRIVISLAGIHVEGIFVGLLVLLAVLSPPGWVHDLSWATALVSETRVLFNLNPFLRLDGYFVLADCLSITNMRAKAFKVVCASLPRIGHAFRPIDFVRSAEEKQFLFFYGIGSVLGVATGIAMGGIAIYGLLVSYVGQSASVAVAIVLSFIFFALAYVGLCRYAKSLIGAQFARGFYPK